MLICYESYMEGVPNAPELSMFLLDSLSFLKNVFRLGRCKFAQVCCFFKEKALYCLASKKQKLSKDLIFLEITAPSGINIY